MSAPFAASRTGKKTHVPDLAAAMPAMPHVVEGLRCCNAASDAGAAKASDESPLQRFSRTHEQLLCNGVESIAGYVLFSGHTDALALFQAAKAAGFPVRISPTPRDARSSCGVALLVPCDVAADVYGVACAEDIAVESMIALPRQIDAHRDRYC